MVDSKIEGNTSSASNVKGPSYGLSDSRLSGSSSASK